MCPKSGQISWVPSTAYAPIAEVGFSNGLLIRGPGFKSQWEHVNEYIDYNYDHENFSYTAKKKFASGNTVEIEFYLSETSIDGSLNVEVGLRSFAKRKHKDKPDFEFRVTGRDALEPAIWATQCLLEFPSTIFSESYFAQKDRVIYSIFWSDARRRDIYHKWLSRYGFYYDNSVHRAKCISKIYHRG